ncbi:chemotaxis protein CheW [Oceanospirillum sediminis]|uniref:Chemotaxis protein CheW n=1 Tax=Oceanospirillum sediminis TaxID=2760088 RepID=A0A839IM61_9GAMM|nr:chemotaxis protein CheW [Oceanospirillum sediminis]MBB1486315.1 chemotaxis protein CheW [Oceanospirillum sediminis]
MLDQWIGFSLGGERYVHSVEVVKEVLPFSEVFPVPGAPPEIMGIVNIRGEVVTIVSGHQLLTLMKPDKGSNLFILVLELDIGLWGVVVDAVTEIASFDSQSIEPAPETSQKAEVIRGMVYKDNLLHIVADFTPRCSVLSQQI